MLDPETSSTKQDKLILKTRLMDTKLRTLCQYVAVALLEGSVKRPPLPLELVRAIFISGGFRVPAPSLHVRTETPFSIVSANATPVRRCWMVTETFDAPTLLRLASIRLTTFSRYQGCMSLLEHGSWSWFELAIISPIHQNSSMLARTVQYEHVKRQVNGAQLAWVSHHHPVERAGMTRKFEGMVFDVDHELWTYLSPGDRLGVFGCVVYPTCACIGVSAELEFDEYFDPSSWS